MNVESAVMKVDWFQATDAYRNYRKAIKENRATKDDVLLARAYHAMLRGKKVLDVGAAIGNAGVDEHAMPRLAIARADWTRVFSRRDTDGKFRFTSRANNWGRRPAGEVAVRIGETPAGRWNDRTRGVDTVGEGVAQVPTIPPQFRPTAPLAEFHILFEAVWTRQPTSDPILLKRIGDNDVPLFVVLAAWDLTPLEQAVLRAKL
jgi:hypothetical protein